MLCTVCRATDELQRLALEEFHHGKRLTRAQKGGFARSRMLKQKGLTHGLNKEVVRVENAVD